MHIVNAEITEVKQIGRGIYITKFKAPVIASQIKPGQFLNIKVNRTTSPLLRRPFSVCDVENGILTVEYNVTGTGTKIMSEKKPGEFFDVMGPLGKGFNCEGDYETAVLVAGGLGTAPFPYLIRRIKDQKKIRSYIGAASKDVLIKYGFENIESATDDGTEGFKGNVVELLQSHLDDLKKEEVKIFGCGPEPMLKALRQLALDANIACELSTECAMACGFGICQGCPIEPAGDEESYKLVCKDGPVFNAKDIVL